MTTNYAKFTINGLASVDSDNNAGVNVTNGQTLTLTLETNPAPVLSATYEVYDPNDTSSPTKSKDAPNITFVSSSTSTEVLANPNGNATIVMPSYGVHSYVIRCTVSLGGSSTDHVYERLVAIQAATVPAIRKTVPNETNQYDQNGFSDELNDMVDAISFISGGFLDNFGGNAFSNRWTTSTSGTGTATIPAAVPDSVGGNAKLYINRDGNPNTAVLDTYSFEYDSALSARAKFRFKLSTATEVQFQIGFYQDASNHVLLEADTYLSGLFRFRSSRGGTPTHVSTGVSIDTDWHTAEIRFNGSSGTAEMIFDGDTSNILSIANASLPSTRWFEFLAQQFSSTSSAGAAYMLIDYIGVTQNMRTS